MRPLRLYINVDHVATVREARKTDEPDPLAAARAAEAAGADGITIHLREDRRHIQDRDVVAIAGAVSTVCNLELAARDEIVALACQLKPYQVTLVPERREEVTTEGGLDLTRRDPNLRSAIRRLDEAGLHVSLFIDPDPAMIDAAKDLGVPAVELHTGRYSHRWRDDDSALDELRRGAEHAAGMGLAVHAGHGLTYQNVQPIARIAAIEELNIGHSIVGRALFTGIGAAVKEMKELMQQARLVSTAPRRAEFFALEANEYLADLEPLAAARDRPDAERLVRGARALRGAALMAGLGTYARAAAGLEALARQVRDHALSWDPHAREAWVEGLAALRALVGRAASWEASDDRQALALAERFEQVMTGRPARATAPAPAALTPGVRAFIARESALIAGSLEQASRALAPIPPAAALAGVLERMQSLRGLGASAELSPLPELLDAMEVATRALLSDAPAPPNVAAVFADAAHALSAMARSIADAGQVITPPELASIAQRLLEAYGSEADVISIAMLAPDGADPIVHEGTAPAAMPEADPVPVELVSVGDHLLMVAEALARPVSPVARDLRLFVLHRTLAAMPSRSATGRFLTPLADAISAAIGNRVAIERPDAFVAMVRGCGRFLVEAGGINDRVAITRRRDAIATSLVMVGLGAPAGGFEPKLPAATPSEVSRTAATAVEAPQTPRPVAPLESTLASMPEFPTHDEPEAPSIVESEIVSIASLAPADVTPVAPVVPVEALAHDDETDVVAIESPAHDDESDIVSIESLAHDDAADIVPIESLAPDAEIAAPPLPQIPAEAPGAPSRLEQAFIRRGALTLAAPDASSTLSGLIAAEIVPVTTLLYRGPAAWLRAEEVRLELTALLAEPAISIDQLRPHLSELLDLIPLTRDAA